MDTEKQEEFRKLISQEIEKTEKHILEYKELTRPVEPDNAIGRISRMDAINNKSVNEAALRQAELKLSNLKEALKSVRDPEFGLCIKCKRPIANGRLIFMPQSRLCMNCAQ